MNIRITLRTKHYYVAMAMVYFSTHSTRKKIKTVENLCVKNNGDG